MKLGKIKNEDLNFSNDIEDDRTNTYLSLSDYDWMEYSLKTRFKTKEYGTLDVEFTFFGLIASRMDVKQRLNGAVTEYTYEYPTEIFQKNIVIFMENHIKAWSSHYAFDGETEVVNFYNEVIEKGILLPNEEEEKR